MSLLFVIVGLLLLKFFINLSKYARTKRYLSRYERWLSNPDSKLLESKAQVIKLLKDAEVADSHFDFLEPAGYGQLRNVRGSLFENFPASRKDIPALTYRMFRQAIGTYRSRMLETFNPLYWIETVIHLPREALRYLGVPPESGIVKMLQLIWWIVGSVFVIVWVVFRPEIGAMVRDLLSNLVS